LQQNLFVFRIASDFFLLLFQKQAKTSMDKAITVSEDGTEEDTFLDSVDVDQGWVAVETGGMMMVHIDY